MSNRSRGAQLRFCHPDVVLIAVDCAPSDDVWLPWDQHSGDKEQGQQWRRKTRYWVSRKSSQHSPKRTLPMRLLPYRHRTRPSSIVQH